MKKNHKCPKCKSENVVGFAARPSVWYGRENSVNYLQIGPLQIIAKETYVCGDCGYSEEWIKDVDLGTVNSYKDSNKDLTQNEE